MDYYAFEYSVLMHLNDMLKIESINIGKETYNATSKIRNTEGKIEDRIVAKYDINSKIVLNFGNNFHYSFDREMLLNEYNYAKYSRLIFFSIRNIAEKIKDNIIKEFAKQIIK